MTALRQRHWTPTAIEDYIQRIAAHTDAKSPQEINNRISKLAVQNNDIHEKECFNLNPATNVMNPDAQKILACGLSSRPSLGYPTEKYETGLEALEEIEVIASELCAEVFQAPYCELRALSGAMANLFAFMAVCEPGDAIIVPPASIGGHVTHHLKGCAGRYHLKVYQAPVDEDSYSYDIPGLRRLAKEVQPKLISIGGSLNLFPHPVTDIRAVADEVGAKVLFDAAHLCGLIAGRTWDNPLQQGAHIMTMSTYKSLGGPSGGILLTNDADIAEKLDAVAYPGLTANFDMGRVAALALTLLDWRTFGNQYAKAMVDVAQSLAAAIAREGIPVFASAKGFTQSHQFALEAAKFKGARPMAEKLRKAGFLACGIGLPLPQIDGDMNGLRMGSPEIVRWGVGPQDTGTLAALIAKALRSDNPAELAPTTARLRCRFNKLQFIHHFTSSGPENGRSQ